MDIIGYPNYTIDRDGTIKNKNTDKVVSQSINSNGYRKAYLANNGIGKVCAVHRLLALCYIPNPENKRCIDHIDRNKLNNDLSNLRWATDSENNINKPFREDYCISIRAKSPGVPYMVSIMRNYKRNYVGTFATIEEARAARDKWLAEN